MWPVGYPAFGPQGGPQAYVDDLSTGRLARSQTLAIAAGDYQPLLTQVGRWLVYAGNGTTAIRDDLNGNPRVLGLTPFFAPSAEPGHVWLFRFRYAALRPQGQGRVRLYLIPIASSFAQPRAVPSSAAHLFAKTAWSANGSWLLYQGPGGHLWAYQVTSGTIRASSTPCCQYTVMVAAPSNPG
jgi:hypothetical protein